MRSRGPRAVAVAGHLPSNFNEGVHEPCEHDVCVGWSALCFGRCKVSESVTRQPQSQKRKEIVREGVREERRKRDEERRKGQRSKCKCT